MQKRPIPRKVILSICKDTEKCYKKDIDSVKNLQNQCFSATFCSGIAAKKCMLRYINCT